MSVDFSGLKDNNVTQNLVIYDSEYLDHATKYSQLGKKLEEVLDEYVKCIKELSDSLDGEFAQKLGDFSKVVEVTMKGVFLQTYKMQKENMQKYISEIDNADDVLF